MYFGIKRVCVIESWSFSHFTSKVAQSIEYTFFECTPSLFSVRHAFPKNAIKRVEVCGALTWFLKRKTKQLKARKRRGLIYNGPDH